MSLRGVETRRELTPGNKVFIGHNNHESIKKKILNLSKTEVINMQPPDRLLKKGINTLPTLGDGRQSGTSASPSILHVSPESAIGGDLGIVKTGDQIKIDLNKRRVDLLIPKTEFKIRRKNRKSFKFNNQTPWQEIFRDTVGQLEDGACINSRGKFLKVSSTKGIPRDSH